jgi:hypothetical protein
MVMTAIVPTPEEAMHHGFPIVSGDTILIEVNLNAG